MRHNVQDPDKFLQNFAAVNDAVYAFMDTVVDEGCKAAPDLLFGEEHKPCYQVARQVERPEEFREALLDMLRVTFATKMFGNLLLNSNPLFFYQSIPQKPFTLGYISVLSDPGEGFPQLWERSVVPKFQQYNYSLDRTTSLFISVAGSFERMTVDVLNGVCEVTQAGFSVEDVFENIVGSVKGVDVPLRSEVYSGYVWDNNLFDRLRVSLWLIIALSRGLLILYSHRRS